MRLIDLLLRVMKWKVLIDDLELRRGSKSCAAFVHEDIIGCVEGRMSCWPRLKRIIGQMLMF